MADVSNHCRERSQRRGAGYPDSKRSTGMTWPCSNGRVRPANSYKPTLGDPQTSSGIAILSNTAHQASDSNHAQDSTGSHIRASFKGLYRTAHVTFLQELLKHTHCDQHWFLLPFGMHCKEAADGVRLLRYFTPSLLTKALLESSVVRDTVAKCTYTHVHSPARDAATHLQRCPNNQRSTSLSLTGLMHSHSVTV